MEMNQVLIEQGDLLLEVFWQNSSEKNCHEFNLLCD